MNYGYLKVHSTTKLVIAFRLSLKRNCKLSNECIARTVTPTSDDNVIPLIYVSRQIGVCTLSSKKNDGLKKRI